MASVSTYLNFDGRTEAAFSFYQRVFGTTFHGPVVRVGDVPLGPGESRTDAQARRIAHCALKITGGHVLRGTDVPQVDPGDHVLIMLEPDTREEAERLFLSLAEEGDVVVPLADQPWGAYFGQLVDQFCVPWLVHIEQG